MKKEIYEEQEAIRKRNGNEITCNGEETEKRTEKNEEREKIVHHNMLLCTVKFR